MRYKSTRDVNNANTKGFEQILISSYAEDGGLYVPTELPVISHRTFSQWKSESFSFPQICAAVIGLFTDDIDDILLVEMANAAFKSFNGGNDQQLPITQLENLILLDTSQGPTFSFKDIGQQMTGKLINHVLGKRGQVANIIIETSGDTGPAAIAGVKGHDNVEIFCLYPFGRVSEVQELQMIAIQDDNVHVFRTEGNTDEQASVLKEVFQDRQFVEEYNVCSVNSINWFRIAAQSSYFIWSYLQIAEHFGDPVSYIIPTGAFGNAMGGLLAQRMGLPIDRIICATNANDIVHRTIAFGDMRMTANIQTESPAMDIQFAYNLERMLYYINGEDSNQLLPIMTKVEKQYRYDDNASGAALPPEMVKKIQEVFSSVVVSDSDTLETIKRVYMSTKGETVLCPHSAIAVHAGQKEFAYLQQERKDLKLVCVLTAHPCKFEDCVRRALLPEVIPQFPCPENIAILHQTPHRFQLLQKIEGNDWRNDWIRSIKKAVVERKERKENIH
mmetsp:Transcript_2203/g.3427  ORF Transcript_2203/g.3427 Transcript_2203/m.3427 type:complete len:502 (+) Transcript_2203:23-1528(+)